MFGNVDRFRFNHDRFGFSPHIPSQIKGVVKAKPTGNLLGDKKQYVGVIVQGYELPARPCFGFGGFAFLPTQEWLDKYKNEIFFWVIFEEHNIRNCVFLGWAFNNGKEPADVDTQWPNKCFFRTVHFKEVFNDEEQFHALYFEENYVKFGKDGHEIKTSKLQADIDGDTLLKSKNHIVTADSIKLGSETATESGVLGDKLNALLKDTLTETKALADTLAQNASNLATISAANSFTSPLSASFTVLSQKAAAVSLKLSAIIGKLALHLSKKVKID